MPALEVHLKLFFRQISIFEIRIWFQQDDTVSVSLLSFRKEFKFCLYFVQKLLKYVFDNFHMLSWNEKMEKKRMSHTRINDNESSVYSEIFHVNGNAFIFIHTTNSLIFFWININSSCGNALYIAHNCSWWLCLKFRLWILNSTWIPW